MFPTGSHTRALVEQALLVRGAPVTVVAESHQPEVLREMARLAVGWTVLPEVQASSPGRRSRAGRHLSVLTTRRLVVARRAGRIANPAADALVASLAERAAPLPSPR
jgi:DNA-binding transcriptional LysR family regulator